MEKSDVLHANKRVFLMSETINIRRHFSILNIFMPLSQASSPLSKSISLSIYLTHLLVNIRTTCLVSVSQLLTNNIFTNARRRNKVVQLVEELHTFLMMLRSSITQLVPKS